MSASVAAALRRLAGAVRHAMRGRHAGLSLALMALILLLAAGARFHLLGAQSLWHDEGNSYVQSTRSLRAIADHAARDIHPPGYYWLLAVWRRLAGDTEFGLRSFSAFASIATVALAYALGRRLYGRPAGLVASGLVALNTFSIYYAQEARMYALLALWSAASMWAFTGFIHSGLARSSGALLARSSPLTRWALALGLVNAAGLWTQYAFPFVMLAQGALFAGWLGVRLFEQRRENSADGSGLMPLFYTAGIYAAANLLTLALFLPWLPTALDQITQWPSTGQPVTAGEALPVILARLASGVTVSNGLSAVSAFLLMFGLLNLPASGQASASMRAGWRMLLPVVWVLVTVGGFLAFGLYREANLKFLLPAQAAFALWIGRGVWVLWALRIRRESPVLQLAPKAAALLASVSLLVTLWDGLHPLYHDPAYRRDDYRGIAAVILADARPGDAIILNAPNQQEVFSYYYEGDAAVFPLPRGLGGDDAAALDETRHVIAMYDRIFAVLWATNERDPNGIVEGVLNAEAFEVDDAWYGSVRLVRYVTPVDLPEPTLSGARFGPAISLRSYAVAAQNFVPGGVIQAQFTWETSEPLNVRYAVFVQLLNSGGVLVAQRDAEPGGGRSPTTTWQPGELVTDNHALVIPAGLPPGTYTLIAGLYDPADALLARLPVDETTGDYIILAELALE